MSAFRYDPHGLDETTLDYIDNLTDDEIRALFDDDPTPIEIILLTGYARPATAAPRQLDPRRGLDTLPALDDYQPTGSEAP
ncbi:hypothetical protein [Streptomyces cyaneofuscatus]|uniref:hypothetical protein n=1 Tax=Streptomyces cyaneofuscatus TaxID=66883 RepID=UPI0013DC42E3|nr:hypothetical protein [Streptomyces cyaneofuscatus]NDZ63591.1 hypothetical protein [Streptomyces cyaneofuscatus]